MGELNTLLQCHLPLRQVAYPAFFNRRGRVTSEARIAAVRDIVGEERFLEVYLSAPLDVCRRRDGKGLYEMATSGEVRSFSGLTAPYEAPGDPQLVVPTHELSVEACVELIEQAVRERCTLP